MIGWNDAERRLTEELGRPPVRDPMSVMDGVTLPNDNLVGVGFGCWDSVRDIVIGVAWTGGGEERSGVTTC